MSNRKKPVAVAVEMALFRLGICAPAIRAAEERRGMLNAPKLPVKEKK